MINLNDNIMEQLTNFAEIMGTSPENVIVEALKQYLAPYTNSDHKIEYQKGYLLRGGNTEIEKLEAKNTGKEVEITKIPVFIIDETSIFGNPYYKIIDANNKQIMSVPKEEIEVC